MEDLLEARMRNKVLEMSKNDKKKMQALKYF